MNEKNIIWITWENQIRNESMSHRLGADYHLVLVKGSRLKRYLLCGIRTVGILYRNRKKTIFVQNPSIVLSFIAVLIKFFLRYRLIIDAHNSGVYPDKRLQWIANFVNKKASYVIVTNPQLADFIISLNGNPLVLPDPLPDMNCKDDIASAWTKMPLHSVMAICSWASDEPYLEMIQAAKITPEINFYITGKSKGKELEYGQPLPKNLTLTGFVPENDYRLMLKNTGAVVDLTTRDNCLVCGAYEAISAGKPVILSDTLALKAYFGKEAYYVKNEAESISKKVREIFLSYESASIQAKKNRYSIEEKWAKLFDDFKRKIFNS